jgi:hypothetical protein
MAHTFQPQAYARSRRLPLSHCHRLSLAVSPEQLKRALAQGPPPVPQPCAGGEGTKAPNNLPISAQALPAQRRGPSSAPAYSKPGPGASDSSGRWGQHPTHTSEEEEPGLAAHQLLADGAGSASARELAGNTFS